MTSQLRVILRVSIIEQTMVVNVVVGVSNRLSVQEEEVDKAFRQLDEASHSQDLILMEDFRILRGRSWAKSRITTLDFRRPVFGLLSNLLGTVPWEEGPGERTGLAKLADFHGSPPQSSKTIHPREQGVK